MGLDGPVSLWHRALLTQLGQEGSGDWEKPGEMFSGKQAQRKAHQHMAEMQNMQETQVALRKLLQKPLLLVQPAVQLAHTFDLTALQCGTPKGGGWWHRQGP